MENRNRKRESRLEKIVHEVMARHAEEALRTGKFQVT